MDIEDLDDAVDMTRKAIGLDDNLKVGDTKFIDYGAGRHLIVKALFDAGLISESDLTTWIEVYR